jgi:hypothetical protein
MSLTGVPVEFKPGTPEFEAEASLDGQVTLLHSL